MLVGTHVQVEPFDGVGVERRRTLRMQVRACAKVMESGHLGTIYRITDLSLGGAQLCGTPSLRRGETYRLVLALSGEMMATTAECIWVGLDGTGSRISGVHFEETYDPRLEAFTASLHSEIGSQTSVILAVDPMEYRLDALVSCLRVLGYDAEGVLTPLQAVRVLVDGAVDTVVVASDLSSVSGDGFLEFVAEAFPEVDQRILMTDRDLERLSSNHSATRVLPIPWDLLELEQTFGAAGGNP